MSKSYPCPRGQIRVLVRVENKREKITIRGEIISVLYPPQNSYQLFSAVLETDKNYLVELKFNGVKDIQGIKVGANIEVSGVVSYLLSEELLTKNIIPEMLNPKYELL